MIDQGGAGEAAVGKEAQRPKALLDTGALQAAIFNSGKLFVNLHSADLNDEELFSPEAPLSRIADRVVLEVTERASLHGVKDVVAGVAKLKALGYEIAIDDLGAGHAGLTSFTQLDPEIAKLDMSLVRGVDADVRRQSIVRSMKQLCDDLGILVIAEGGRDARRARHARRPRVRPSAGIPVREARSRVRRGQLVSRLALRTGAPRSTPRGPASSSARRK
jgi:EAL domain-containing protein (putative c-di-GMP-specific phosphodiesterase class I)